MAVISWFTLLYGFSIIICLIILRWISKYLILRKRLRKIPGPWCLPFLGISTKLINIDRKDRFKWFNDLCLKYKNGMVLIWIGVAPHLTIRKPSHLEIILSSNLHIRKAHTYKTVEPWLGNGLITSTGNTWMRHRRLITPAFYFGILEEYKAVMQEKAQVFVEILRSKLQVNPNKAINIYPIVTNFTLDVISKTAMGVDLDSQMQPETSYVKEIHNATRLAPERNLRPWLKLDFIYHHTQMGNEFKRAVHVIRNFTEMIIKRKILQREGQALKKIEDKTHDEFEKPKLKSFLDLLLDTLNHDEKSLSFDELREEVNTFMFAGHDTTAAGIMWSLFSLGNAPEIQTKIHKELKEVFDGDQEPATTKQLSELKYLDCVIKEALRLYPPVPAISRLLESDLMIDEHIIPKGTTIAINIYQLHHDPEIWDDPETFDPDRFLPENTKKRNPYSYIPFSAGPRNCIGQKFAFLELKAILTEILRNWCISSALKHSEIDKTTNIVLRSFNDKVDLYFIPLKH